MLGTLRGDTLQTGPGGAYHDGVLGSAMQSGPGGAYSSGVLGEHLQSGPGRALRDGSLGSPMQRGEGSAYREGSLGMSLSFTDSNIIAAALGGILAMVLWKKKVTKPGFLGIT